MSGDEEFSVADLDIRLESVLSPFVSSVEYITNFPAPTARIGRRYSLLSFMIIFAVGAVSSFEFTLECCR